MSDRVDWAEIDSEASPQNREPRLEAFDPVAAAADALEQFARSADVSFERPQAIRLLREAENSVPGDDCGAWTQRLIDAGNALALRVRGIECTFAEALDFVRQGIPVLGFSRNMQDGQDAWLMICRFQGRRILVSVWNGEREDRNVSVRAVRRKLAIKGSPRETGRWVIGQAALPCEAASIRGEAAATHHQHGSAADGHSRDFHHDHVSPVTRLIRLMRPEASDLWVILVFSLIVAVLALATPIAVEAMVNTVAFGKLLTPVIMLAVLLFAFLGFDALMRTLLVYMAEIIQRRFFVRVVEDIGYRLPRVAQEELDGVHGPELVNRFFDTMTVQKVMAKLLLEGIAIVLSTVVGMAVLAFYHPFLLGFDIALLVSGAFIVFVLGRGAMRTAIEESRTKYATAAWLQELARHPTAFKLNGGSQLALDRADRLAIDYIDARRKHFRVVLRQVFAALGMQAIAATALLGLGGWLVIREQLTIGQLVAAELIVAVIVGSFAKIGKLLESYYDMLAAVDKLGHIFDLRTDRQDRRYFLSGEGPALVQAREISYAFGDHKRLSKIAFEVGPGDTVAITAPPGAGKSILMDLLCGLRRPDEGFVCLDGVDLRELRPDSLRDHLAIARGFEVFEGTLEENVHLNRPHVRSVDVRDALSQAGLLAEAMEMPDGLRTRLQTHGAPLSPSQTMRLMIARAVAGRPRLLLIDGALDGLSDEMGRGILKRLATADAEHRPWTIIVATVREAVIEACDRVITLHDAERIPAHLLGARPEADA